MSVAHSDEDIRKTIDAPLSLSCNARITSHARIGPGVYDGLRIPAALSASR